VQLEGLLENLGLEVKPFATCTVASGWRLPLSAQRVVTLHFVLRGQGCLVIPGSRARALPLHSLAVVPPGLSHHLEVDDGRLVESTPRVEEEPGLSHLRAGPQQAESLFVVCGHIRATWAGNRGLFDHLREPVVVEFADRPLVGSLFETLLAEQTSDAPGRKTMMAALMQQCLVELFRRLCERDDCRLPWLSALADPRLARALEAIHANPARSHSLESLALAAAMSRSAFAARFRAVFDQTPMDYLRDVRLREAARLLRQPELSVDAAAVRAGFTSRSHFTRAFRRLFGQAPGDYRSRPRG
jgi:AraC family transcriptional activator of mtrCDE